MQVVPRSRGLCNGSAAEEHEDVAVGFDVGEQSGDPAVAPVKANPWQQVT